VLLSREKKHQLPIKGIGGEKTVEVAPHLRGTGGGRRSIRYRKMKGGKTVRFHLLSESVENWHGETKRKAPSYDYLIIHHEIQRGNMAKSSATTRLAKKVKKIGEEVHLNKG